MLHVFLQSLLLGYSGAIMPGSLLTFTIDRSLKYGARGAMLVPLGHVLAELALVVAIFFGFGKYLGSTAAQIAIGLFGGALLIYMGGTMIKGSLQGTLTLAVSEGEVHRAGGSLLISGALLSVSNPYFIIWWAVVGLGLIMNAYKLLGIGGIVLFYLGHAAADLTWYGFVAALVSRTRSLFSPKVYRILVIILGALLVAFGGGFLLNSLNLGGFISPFSGR